MNALNGRRKDTVIAGSYICADELMSSWEGYEGKYHHRGMPHVTKIKRKPKGVGAEIKCAADCESGIMLKLEIQEGESMNKTKKFANDFPFHVAITLRLFEDWFYTDRCGIADSAFASLLCAEELVKKGMQFLGIVKTASKRYPKAYLQQWATKDGVRRGDHKVVKTTISIVDHKNGEEKQKDIYGVCWKSKVAKTIIGTCGSTTPGDSHEVQRTKVVTNDAGVQNTEHYKKSTRCPVIINQLFKGFNTIDVHDHYRQGTLRLEICWRTHKWWHRVFATLFGVIVTDAYFMYRLDYIKLTGSEVNMISYENWVAELASELIFNDEDQIATRKKVDSESSDSDSSSTSIQVSHHLFLNV